MDIQEKEAYDKLFSALKDCIDLFRRKPHYFLNEHDVQAFVFSHLNSSVVADREQVTPWAHCELSGHRKITCPFDGLMV